MMDERPALGVIGGSGLYDFEGMGDVERREIETPFGDPSSPITLGTLGGRRLAFLARHGLNHTLSPSEVNYRANIYSLKSVGVRRVVAVSACGSLREDYAPGDIVVPDQLFDHTKHRAPSFFGGGLVAHVGVAEPFCPQLSDLLSSSVEAEGGAVHRGGNYITIEGPRFSTRAESNTYRAWGMSLIGMTTSPEAFLAREAELCYAVMAHVTDYDVWHITEEEVSVSLVVRTLQRNTALAKRSIARLLSSLPADFQCSCGSALAGALITHPEAIPESARRRLGVLVAKYLD
jgi:5'-methylthioadenosine phosphorylase